VFPDPDGDAKRIHRGLSWFGQRRPYVQRGEREYCISLHRSACVGVTSYERGSWSQVSKKKKKKKRKSGSVAYDPDDPLGGALCLIFYGLKWRPRGIKKL
jgi:hypothetical protein